MSGVFTPSLSHLAESHQAIRFPERPMTIKASPKKARRRGLRRPTPALTTAILGAVLTASLVRAQQPTPSGSDSAGRPAISDSAGGNISARKPVVDPVYGMSATRGARYLLRNGLDYLNYQQYERSLKFLRQAESHKDELNDAERQVLKQGIESAQRGLREAADVDSPYALSEQSRDRNGFRPAKPETRVVGRADRSKGQGRQPMVKRSIPLNVAANDADEQGEPIRLASGEAAADKPNSTPRSTQADSADPRSPQDYDRPRTFPEIPKLPKVAQGLTDADIIPNEREVSADQGRGSMAPPAGLVGAKQVAKEDAPNPVASATPPAILSPAMSAPNSSELAQPFPIEAPPSGPPNLTVVDMQSVPSPPLNKTVKASDPGSPAHREMEDASPASMPQQPVNASPTPAMPPASVPLAAGAAEIRPLLPAELGVPEVAANPPPQAAPVATIPVATTTAGLPELGPPLAVTDAPPQTAPGAVAPHAAITAGPGDLSTPVATTNAPPAAAPETAAPPVAITTAPAGGDVLPPLPADLSSTTGHSNSASATAPAATIAPSDAPAIADDLPPLPGDLSSSAALAASAPSTARATSSVENPSSTAPSPSPESSAPDSSVHKEDEGLPSLPDRGEKPEIAVPSATASPSSVQPGGTVPAAEVVQPSSPLTSARSTDVISNPPSLAPNPEPAQEPGNPTATGVTEPRDLSSLPPAIETTAPAPSPSPADAFIPNRSTPPSTLRPELKREVEMIVRKQEDELRRKTPAQPLAPARDTIVSDLRAQTQLDISRAPSPAEARTIKAIPVPEDWVPLPPRTWSPQRKYWAAAATCHLPLYFQDPVLERYGHSVEQFVGPIGRFLTYPVDDPTQSTQRNQILQPFFSAGLFGLQIAALPYNVLMDPPWEAQYDLGYYRPGDLIPTDTYWLPLHGYGPPLRGSSY